MFFFLFRIPNFCFSLTWSIDLRWEVGLTDSFLRLPKSRWPCDFRSHKSLPCGPRQSDIPLAITPIEILKTETENVWDWCPIHVRYVRLAFEMSREPLLTVAVANEEIESLLLQCRLSWPAGLNYVHASFNEMAQTLTPRQLNVNQSRVSLIVFSVISGTSHCFSNYLSGW